MLWQAYPRFWYVWYEQPWLIMGDTIARVDAKDTSPIDSEIEVGDQRQQALQKPWIWESFVG